MPLDERQLIRQELQSAVNCLTDEYALAEQDQVLRGAAIVHVRRALLLLTGIRASEIAEGGAV